MQHEFALYAPFPISESCHLRLMALNDTFRNPETYVSPQDPQMLPTNLDFHRGAPALHKWVSKGLLSRFIYITVPSLVKALL